MVLYTDASDIAVKAALVQERVVVKMFSKKFKGAQMLLQEYDVELRYLAGEANSMADSLSLIQAQGRRNPGKKVKSNTVHDRKPRSWSYCQE